MNELIENWLIKHGYEVTNKRINEMIDFIELIQKCLEDEQNKKGEHLE